MSITLHPAEIHSIEIIPQQDTPDDPYAWSAVNDADHIAVYARDHDGFAIHLKDCTSVTEAVALAIEAGQGATTHLWTGERFVHLNIDKENDS